MRSVAIPRRLPYQTRPGELDTIARQQAERSAAELYAYTPGLPQDTESRPMYEWVLRRAAQTTRGVARVDLVRPRCVLITAICYSAFLLECWRVSTGRKFVQSIC